MTTDNGFGALRGAVVEPQSSEQQEKEIDNILNEYVDSDDKATHLHDVVTAITKQYDVAKYSDGDKTLYADALADFNDAIKKLQTIDDEMTKAKNISDYTKILKQQSQEIKIVQEKTKKIAEITGINIKTIEENLVQGQGSGGKMVQKKISNIEGDKKTQAEQNSKLFSFFEDSKKAGNENKSVSVEVDGKLTTGKAQKIDNVEEKISWHEAKTEAAKYAQNNKAVFRKLTDIKRKLSQKDKEIEQFKKGTQERNDAIKKAKEFRIKSVQELYKFVQEQKATAKQEAEQNNTKKVERKKEVNEMYDDVLIDAEQNHSRNNAQIEDFIRDARKSVKNKKDEIDKAKSESERQVKIQEVADLKERLAKELSEIVAQKIEHDKHKKQKAQKGNKQKIVSKSQADTTDVEVQAEAEQVDIAEEVNILFDSDEFKKYIETEKNRERIEKYKKAIIAEVEQMSGGVIDLQQVALKYVKKQRASRVFDILEDRIENLAKQKSVEELDKIQKIRDATDITLKNPKTTEESIYDLNVDNVEQSNEALIELTKKVWTEFAVRGYLYIDKETGKVKIDESLNTDCEVSLWILKQAGINVDDVEFVAPGDFVKGKINIDTKGIEGIEIMEDGTASLDHHASDSPSDTSATEKTYEAMINLGMLEKSESMDRLVEFINQVDNFDYPNKKDYFNNYFNNSWKTLLGVYRRMSAEELFKFFEHGQNIGQEKLSPTEVLKPTLLKKFKIDKEQKMTRMEKQENFVRRKLETLKEMEKDGFIIDSDRYGKICVDIGNAKGYANVNNDSARAFGCDTYLIWNKVDNNFFMSSLVGKSIEDDFAQGKRHRGTMYIKPKSVDEEIMQLRDVLDKMTDGKLKPSEKLEETLANNGEIETKKDIELSPEDEKKFEAYLKYARKSIHFIGSMNYEEFGITGKKVFAKKGELKDIMWKQLKSDINKGKKFVSINTRDVLSLIKDKA